MKKLLILFFCCLFVSIFIGCATSTISSKIRVLPLEDKKADGTGISDFHLIQGGGMDWGDKIIPINGRSSAIFGSSHKSFGESTDYFAALEGDRDELIWAKTYGGTHLDTLETAISSVDGGYLLLGTSQSLFFTALKVISPNTFPRPFLLKIDTSGNIEWATLIDMGINDSFYAITPGDIIETSDKGYVLVGYAGKKDGDKLFHIVLVKFAANGEEKWCYSYDAINPGLGYKIVKTNDGNLMVAGLSKETEDWKLLLLKIDQNGNPLWSKIYPIKGGQVPMSLMQFPDGAFLISGINRIKGSNEDSFAVKLSNDGKVIWGKLYSGPYNYESSILQGHDQDLLMFGQSVKEFTDDPNSRKGSLILLDHEGNIKTTLEISSTSGPTQINSYYRFSDGKYRVIGTTMGLGTRYADITVFTWDPKEMDKNYIPEFKIIQNIIPVEEQDCNFKITPFSPRFNKVPNNLIESHILSLETTEAP